MSTNSKAFYRDYLLAQYFASLDTNCAEGWRPEAETPAGKPPDGAFVEVGFSPLIPPDDVPIALLPAMMRLDKASWVSCVSVAASFAAGVQDGHVVYPVRNTAGATVTNIASVGDVTWNILNEVGATGIPPILGIAYREIGRVMAGPIVRHSSFKFSTGDLVYVQNGRLTTTPTGRVIGVCFSPEAVMLDISGFFVAYGNSLSPSLINDEVEGATTTYSSTKIKQLIDEAVAKISGGA